MFDTLEVVQPQQKQATPVRPATDRQVEVLVNLGLCATPDEARKLTSVQASEQLTNREIGINTESAGGLATADLCFTKLKPDVTCNLRFMS